MSEYGFTKLIELFEAIPETVDITEDVDGERLLQLTEAERLKVPCPIFSLLKTFLNREERFANKDVKYHLITAGNQKMSESQTKAGNQRKFENLKKFEKI